MRRIFLGLSVFALALMGCAAGMLDKPSGAIVTDFVSPVGVSNTGLCPEGYLMLGDVVGTSYGWSILGLVAQGNAGVIAAYANALSKIKGADSLINVAVDIQMKGMFGIVRITTIVRGTAVKKLATTDQPRMK